MAEYSNKEKKPSSKEDLLDIFRRAAWEGNEIFKVIRLNSNENLMKDKIFPHVNGFWAAVQYWESKKGGAEKQSEENEQHSIFRHVFHFYAYDEESKIIKFEVASARKTGGELIFDYHGDLIGAAEKLYFIIEASQENSKTEALLIIANHPDEYHYISGLLLASTVPDTTTGDPSSTGASRIILKKLPTNSKDEAVKCLGIVSEKKFSASLKFLLENKIDDNKGILFSNHDKVSWEQERESQSAIETFSESDSDHEK